MADTRQIVKHYRGTGITSNLATAPAANAITEGEIAINYNATDPALFIKDTGGNIKKFSADNAIDAKIDKKITNIGLKNASANSTSSYVSVTATTESGNIKTVAVATTLGTFKSGTTEQSNGLVSVAAAQDYIDTKINEVTSAAIGIEEGTNVTIEDGSDNKKKISATGTAVASVTDTNKATALALADELKTLSGSVTEIQKDDKYAKSITAVTSENNYITADTKTNARKIAAQVSMLTASTLTTTGKLADAKDVKDYVDNQVKASGVTGAAGDTYVSASLSNNKISVSAITGSTSADTPSGLATAADAKVTMSTASTTNGSLRTYTFKQGTREIGKVEIDKEKFVQYGRVFKAAAATEAPETGKEVIGYSGLTNGTTYIGLQIGASNADISAALAIPANSLVDTYTSSTSNYIEVNNYGIGAKTGDGGLATYAHVTTLSGNVVTKFGDYATSANVVTALNAKANTADYHVKSGAAGTNTTAAISNGNLIFSAVGTSVTATTIANTDLALTQELKALSGKVSGIKIGEGEITIKQAGTKKGSFTVNQTGATTIELTDTTYTIGTTDTAGLTKLFGSTGNATDGAITQSAMTTLLNGKSNTSHTHTEYLKTAVTITNSTTNKITASVTNQALTLGFDNMVIDCGTY